MDTSESCCQNETSNLSETCDMLLFEKYHADQILRPLSAYHQSSMNKNKNTKKRCLALCHGHNHSSKILSTFKGDCYWYMVDINSKNYPDYVGDVSDFQTMSYFPPQYFDIIITMHYPIGIQNNKEKYNLILKNISRLIKPDGYIYLCEFPGLFYWYLKDEEFNELKNQLINIIGDEEYTNFQNEILKKKKSFNIREVMIGNYKGLEKEKINQLLDNKSLEVTHQYMTMNNFKIENEIRRHHILELSPNL
jgi:hypothetical protein